MEKRLIKSRIALGIFLLFGLMLSNQLQAQEENGAQIRIQAMAGSQVSNFRFRDSEKSKDEELSWKNGSMAGIGLERYGKKSIISMGLSTRSAGAFSEFENLLLEWSTRYTDISASYSYKVINLNKSSLYVGTGMSYSLLSSAYQQIGNERFNMLTEKTIATTDFLWNNSLMLKHNITESMYLNLGYRLGLGIVNLETGVNGANQNTRNIFHALTIGVSFRI